MIREEYLRRLVDEAHVDLYLSGNDGARLYWPWRMEPPSEATRSYRNACEMYIIDSDPQDDSVTNRDALDTAHRLDAEVASLQDVYQDKAGTVDAILDGLALADDHAFDGELLLPLQRPYFECYQEIGEPSDHWIGLGGLKDATPHTRVDAAKEFRSQAGYGPRVHGFGWGPVGRMDEHDPMALARAIREDPGLLDSLDYATPVRSRPYELTQGGEHKSVTAAYAGARLIRDLREVTPHPDELEAPMFNQQALGTMPKQETD